MKSRIFISFNLFLLGLLNLEAQYITEVLEYTPAPGQFINAAPWGTPLSTGSITGGVNGTLSLGSFGGYVIIRFEKPVENDPDNPFGVDFTLFGNPTGEWSEPGAVWVMNDVNGNGLADDRWFELAGSDYHFPSSKKEYRVTYSNPGSLQAEDVPWTDHLGNSGIVRAISSHVQPYYPLTDSFPGIPSDSYTLTGTLIQGSVDIDHPPVIMSQRRAFGYADNQARGAPPYTIPDNPYTPEAENSGGDAFDIGWAVDSAGNPVSLEQVDFIRVQTAILNEGGWLGEISTEITGGIDIPPAEGFSGITKLLVVRELPVEIDTSARQLELCPFSMGIPLQGESISWTVSQEWASVDADHLLTLAESGPLTLTATLDSDPSIKSSVSTTVVPGISTGRSRTTEISDPRLYPNPAAGEVRLIGAGDAVVSLFGCSGKLLYRNVDFREGEKIPLTGLDPGIYLVGLEYGTHRRWLKLVKK